MISFEVRHSHNQDFFSFHNKHTEITFRKGETNDFFKISKTFLSSLFSHLKLRKINIGFLYSRYKALFYKMKQKLLVDAKDNCIVILTQFDPKRDLHRLGETKVRINFDSFIPRLLSISFCRNFQWEVGLNFISSVSKPIVKEKLDPNFL